MFTKTSFSQRLSALAFLLIGVLSCVFYAATDISMLDLSSGFSHPLEGWDHIVTMLGVGIWAAQLRGKAIWLLPTTFVGVMSLGGISGAAKYLAVPSAEILIVLSCLIFSILILRKIRFDIKINVLIVAFFAFFHGYAHGAEISTSASLISYTIGFMVATLLLHGVGILVAKVVLLSITFFIAQTFNVAPMALKTITVNHFVMNEAPKIQQVDNVAMGTKPLTNFSPPEFPIFEHFKPLKSYFDFATLLFVFSVSQFICYVFYPKQRRHFSLFLACCFKHSLYSFTQYFQRLRVSIHYLNLNSKGIFMSIRLPKILALLLFSPSFAYAHSSLSVSGFIHPFQGIDHVLPMLAVGFLAAQLRGKAIWILPLTFLGVMTLGGWLGTLGLSIDYAEIIILLSGFVLSILATKKVTFDLKIVTLIVGFFALFHGVAHGVEIANSTDFVSYSVGFISATSLLHLAGILLAQVVYFANRHRFN